MDETYRALIQRYKLARAANDAESSEIIYRTIRAFLRFHWVGAL